jgi:hypothetical protein
MTMTSTNAERITDRDSANSELLIEDRGEENACKDMRKRFCAYTKGIHGEEPNCALKLVHASTAADYHAKCSDNADTGFSTS